MARISQLAGQINRHKNQQAGFVPAPPQGSRYTPYSRAGADGSNHSEGWRRGGFPARGHPRARMPVHRHRTLVLNGASQTNKGSDSDQGNLSDVSNSSWVTKTDRHLQLINSSVYEKEAQARTKAIEQTRLQKQALRDDRERAKLINHLNRSAATAGSGLANPAASGAKYEVTIQGIRFAVVKNGSKLVRIPGTPGYPPLSVCAITSNANTGDLNSTSTPKMATVGGVRFYRSKNGNLYRHGILKAQRYVIRLLACHALTCVSSRQSGNVKKINVPCKMFSMTGNSFVPKKIPNPPRPCRLDWESVSPWISPLTDEQVPVPKAHDAATLTTRIRSPRVKTFFSKGSVSLGTFVISLMS